MKRRDVSIRSNTVSYQFDVGFKAERLIVVPAVIQRSEDCIYVCGPSVITSRNQPHTDIHRDGGDTDRHGTCFALLLYADSLSR